MLDTQFSAIVVHQPCQIQRVNIDNEIKYNNSLAVLQNGVHINLNREESS